MWSTFDDVRLLKGTHEKMVGFAKEMKLFATNLVGNYIPSHEYRVL